MTVIAIIAGTSGISGPAARQAALLTASVAPSHSRSEEASELRDFPSHCMLRSWSEESRLLWGLTEFHLSVTA